MSKDNNNNGKIEKVLNQTVEQRRKLQYEELQKWDHGRTTARQCIENIVEIEKIIFYSWRGPNGQIHKP